MLVLDIVFKIETLQKKSRLLPGFFYMLYPGFFLLAIHKCCLTFPVYLFAWLLLILSAVSASAMNSLR